jgi:hypothetical protein
MIEDNWSPSEEDIEWTREHFARMAEDDTWGVADAVLRKTGSGLIVVSMSPASMLPLNRIAVVCEAIGIDFDSSGAEMVEDAQAAAQQSAREWTHPDTGEPLVNFDLEGAEWVCMSPEEEAWRVVIRQGEDEIALSPMDYHLLAGDELFFSWKGKRVLERHEIIELADEGGLVERLTLGNVFIMPTVYEDVLVPPHLRGLIFVFGDEEE